MAHAARRAASPAVMRFGFFYVPNGMFLDNYHPKGEGGSSFESIGLAAAARFRA